MKLPEKLQHGYTGVSPAVRRQVREINEMLERFHHETSESHPHRPTVSVRKKEQLASHILDAALTLHGKVGGTFNKGLNADLAKVARAAFDEIQGTDRSEAFAAAIAQAERAPAAPVYKTLVNKVAPERLAMSRLTPKGQNKVYLAVAHTDAARMEAFMHGALAPEEIDAQQKARLEAVGIDTSKPSATLADHIAKPQQVVGSGQALCIYLRKEFRRKFEVQADAATHEIAFKDPLSRPGVEAERRMGAADQENNYIFAIAAKDNTFCMANAADSEGLIDAIKMDVGADIQKGANLYFNHSSFFAGKPVVAAGEVITKGSAIKEINNGTGHYQTGFKHMAAGARVLHEQGALTADTTVEVRLYPEHREAQFVGAEAPRVAVRYNARDLAERGENAVPIEIIDQNFDRRPQYAGQWRPAASIGELRTKYRMNQNLEQVSATPPKKPLPTPPGKAPKPLPTPPAAKPLPTPPPKAASAAASSGSAAKPK